MAEKLTGVRFRAKAPPAPVAIRMASIQRTPRSIAWSSVHPVDGAARSATHSDPSSTSRKLGGRRSSGAPSGTGSSDLQGHAVSSLSDIGVVVLEAPATRLGRDRLGPVARLGPACREALDAGATRRGSCG